jgi:hypothetical protein
VAPPLPVRPGNFPVPAARLSARRGLIWSVACCEYNWQRVKLIIPLEARVAPCTAREDSSLDGPASCVTEQLPSSVLEHIQKEALSAATQVL